MNRQVILFPSDVRNSKVVDFNLIKEYEAAENYFDVALFDYYEFFYNGSFILTKGDLSDASVLYRGWMMKPEEYTIFEKGVSSFGGKMNISAKEYETMHIYPNTYPFVQEDAIKTLFFTKEEAMSLSIKDLYKKLGNFMIKDFVKSAKGTSFPAYFDNNVSEEEFKKSMEDFFRIRGNLFTGGICAKSYIKLKKYGGKTNEFRVFYKGGEVLSVSPNSNQSAITNIVPEELVCKYASLPSQFYTVDFAEKEDGTFFVIETGDGQVSGLSPNQDVALFYRHLFIISKEIENDIQEEK